MDPTLHPPDPNLSPPHLVHLAYLACGILIIFYAGTGSPHWRPTDRAAADDQPVGLCGLYR